MSVQLNTPNAGSLREFANFRWIRIDENTDGASSPWKPIHNSTNHIGLNVTRTFPVKIKPNHVCAEFYARASVIRRFNTADFDLDCGLRCSHGPVGRPFIISLLF